MTNNQSAGDTGEKEVCEKTPCPNCKKPLITLPNSNPLFDVQCTRCVFRAQIKTNHSKPKSKIRGAGWDIMDKTLKSGYLAPPLITNFKWRKGQEIRFYPFISRENLEDYQISKGSQREGYRMFNYTDLDKIPYFTLLKEEF